MINCVKYAWVKEKSIKHLRVIEGETVKGK